MTTSTHNIDKTKCPHCSHNLDTVIGQSPGNRGPTPGDCGACFACSSVLFFDKDAVHLATQGDLDKMPSHLRAAFEKATGKPLIARDPGKMQSLTDEEIQKRGILLAMALGAMVASTPVPLRMSILAKALMPVVGSILVEEWDRMMALEPRPCGDPECRCSERQLKVREAFRTLRA